MVEKVREVIQYKNYFEEFLLKQPKKVQDKIFKVIEIIKTDERVPSSYLKSITGTKKGTLRDPNKTGLEHLEGVLLF